MKKILKIALLTILCVCSFVAVFGCGQTSKFTVTFDGDGGTLVSGTIVQVVEDASQIQVPVFEKEGYEFVGWNTIISKIDKDTTVKAQWKAKPFTVTFDGNGGTLIGGQLEQTVYSASELAIPTFVKKGHTLEWDTDISAITSDTIVNATWVANEYILTYDFNGGEVVGETASGKTVVYGQPIGTLPVPVKEGYDFDHWQIGSNFINEATIWDYDANMVANAEYVRETEFVIRYDLQGGQVSSNPNVYSKSTPTFTLNNPTKTGYEFKGWIIDGATTPDLSVTIAKGSTGDKSFKAVWQAKQYTITFDAVDGNCDLSEKKVTFDKEVGELPTCTKDYYEFIGWYIGEQEIKEDTIWAIDQNQTLSAKYIRETDFVIRYDLSGGQAQNNPTSYSKSTPTFTLNNPTKTGYEFKGWISDGATTPDLSVTIAKGSTGDKSFKAVWQAKQYTITFDAVDGNCDLSEKKVTFDKEVGELPTCYKIDHEFSGWYLDGKKIEEDTIWTIDGNRTLVAEYLRADEFSIIYQLGGGKETTNPNKYTEFSQAIVLNSPSRDGYEFIGWTSQDIVEPQISVTIETGTTGNLIFTANWKASEYLLTFDAGDGAVDEQYEQGIVVTYGQEIGELPIPVNKGYNFVGWNIDNGGITKNSVWTYLENKLAVATYVKESEYFITYNLQGGTGANNPSSYRKSDDSFTINNPTKKGYEFIGWTSQDIVEPQISVTIETGTTGNLIFTANWKANQYLLTFDAGDGVIDDQYAQGIIITYGEEIGELPLPVNKGYNFICWSIDNSEITENSVWTYTESKVAVASYVKEIEYSITYNLQGGSGASNPSSYRKSDDSFKLNNPTKKGYDFIGWSGETLSFPQISVTIETGTTGNLSFTANWCVRSYVVALDASDGECSKDKKIVTYSQKVGELPTCQKDGYHFVGWFVGDVEITKDTIWEYDEQITLVAKYKIDLKIKLVLSCTFRGELVTAKVNGMSELVPISVVEGQTLEGILPKKEEIEFMDPEEYYFYAWVNKNGVKVTESTTITPENFPDIENGIIEITIKCQSVNTKFY